jgi:MYXO-CTERM domain-containing protein
MVTIASAAKRPPLLTRIFPAQVDNSFDGYRTALWLLGFYVALKIVMSVNSIFNTESVAVGGDGIPLDTFGPEAARSVLMLFSLMSLGQLALALAALATLIRWRALVPFTYLLLIGEHLARRFIVQSYAVTRTEGTPAGVYVNYALLALLAIGLVLSLLRRRRERT